MKGSPSAGTTLLAALGLTFATGCYTTRVEMSDAQGRLETHRRLNHTFFWGIVSFGSVDAARICDGGEVMPQKSTFFFPKIPTGLVFRDLRRGK